MKVARKRFSPDPAIVSRPMPYFVPPLLSFVAGFIDVVTFAALFGLYVAQVTGSFVVGGAQMIESRGASILIIMLAIPIFLLAAMLTVFLCHFLALRRRSMLGWSLVFESALIAAFYVCVLESPLRDPNGPLTLTASIFALAAMGVQSAMVRLLMQNVASTNVMTTNTSLLGIGAAETLIAWSEKRKFPRSRRAADNFRKAYRGFHSLFQVTLGFLIGAAIGAAVYRAAGVHALIVPVGFVAALALWGFEKKRI